MVIILPVKYSKPCGEPKGVPKALSGGRTKPVRIQIKEETMMIDFYQTRMGQKFYESDVPRIAKALERIADKLDVKEA